MNRLLYQLSYEAAPRLLIDGGVVVQTPHEAARSPAWRRAAFARS